MVWYLFILAASILIFISHARAFNVILPSNDPVIFTVNGYYTVNWDTARGDATVFLYKGFSQIDDTMIGYDSSWTIKTRTGNAGNAIDQLSTKLGLKPGVDYWFSVKNDAGENWSSFFEIAVPAEPQKEEVVTSVNSAESTTPAVPGETASAATSTATSSVTSISSPFSAASSSTASSQNSSSDKGIILGGVIGGIALVGILVLGGICIVKWAPSRHGKGMGVGQDEEMPMPKPPVPVFGNPEYSPSHETLHESPNDRMRHELA